jgi:hypothetical protein
MEYVNYFLPVDRRKPQHAFRAYLRRRELMPNLGIGGAHSKCGWMKVGILTSIFGVSGQP